MRKCTAFKQFNGKETVTGYFHVWAGLNTEDVFAIVEDADGVCHDCYGTVTFTDRAEIYTDIRRLETKDVISPKKENCTINNIIYADATETREVEDGV